MEKLNSFSIQVQTKCRAEIKEHKRVIREMSDESSQ